MFHEHNSATSITSRVTSWMLAIGLAVLTTMPAGFAEETDGQDSGPVKLFRSYSVDRFKDAVLGDSPTFVRSELDGAVTASLSDSPTESVPKTAAKFRDDDYAVHWTAYVETQSTPDGESKSSLVFTAKPDDSYHVYAASVSGEDFSTSFVVQDKAGLLVGTPKTPSKIKTLVIYEGAPVTRYHEGDVTWRLPLRVTSAATAEGIIQGVITYQACTEKACLRPMALQFKFPVQINADQGTVTDRAAAQIAATPYPAAADLASTTKWVDSFPSADGSTPSEAIETTVDGEEDGVDAIVISDFETGSQDLSLVAMLGLAFLGGIILNVMPCVLPVIGLKVMSFISQAGEDRKRVLTLNLAYVGGIFLVFGILAVLATSFSLGWGEQFQDFRVRLAAIVGLFAFSLSYLGVWEIPAPGMASSKASQRWQNKEGLGGAFGKGVFATILATPCSAPLLGSVFSALLGAPPQTVFAVFFAIASGMAFPYVVIGFFPKAASYLPKPGPWMEKFKELMAFVMLGAVAFFFYQFSDEDKLPVFITLLGVWFGCWIIGQVPAWDRLQKRILALVGGVAAAVVIGLFGFFGIQGESELQWNDYDEVALANYQAEGKTVLIDFSAKWCVNCLFNLENAIDTPEVAKLVDDLDAVAIYADWTDYDPAITRKLKELKSKSIPLLAIYPGNDPNKPIILRDLVSQGNVLEALRQAGPSQDPSIARKSNRGKESAQRLVGFQDP